MVSGEVNNRGETVGIHMSVLNTGRLIIENIDEVVVEFHKFMFRPIKLEMPLKHLTRNNYVQLNS